MSIRKRLNLLWIVLGLSVILAGCLAPASPTPTPTEEASPSPEPVTETPEPTPTSPPPTETPEPTATAAPPTETPAPEAQRIALFALTEAGDRRLLALNADGTTTDLGANVYEPAAIHWEGRWVATTDQPTSPTEVDVIDLQADAALTFPVTADFDVFGMAFDAEGSRLAYLEVQMPGGESTPWAIVIADLDEGTTTRFAGDFERDGGMRPGYPIGWSGEDLLINTFTPYTEEGSTGVWAMNLPAGTESTPIDSLNPRQILPGEDYLFSPVLSPERTRLLYLNRDYDYTPENYEPVSYDLAVNQLGWMNLEDGSTTRWVNETEGGALASNAAWSPDGTTALFAEGRYENGTFGSLTAKTVGAGGEPTEVGSVPLPPDGYLTDLEWCAPETAVLSVATAEGAYQLHTMNLGDGSTTQIRAGETVELLGCVRSTESAAGNAGANADVLDVRAEQTDDATWTFEVTVEHPDTGWEDYADGWDVVTPEGEVLKPNAGDPFTRVLLHPHENEQPFTRSQSGITIPDGVTEVRVRAHDLVDGFGGQEIVVDLTRSSGENYEVIRNE